MRRKRLRKAIEHLDRVPEIILLVPDDELRQSIQNMLIEMPADTVKGLVRLALSDSPDYNTYDFSEVDRYIDLQDYIRQNTKNKR